MGEVGQFEQDVPRCYVLHCIALYMFSHTLHCHVKIGPREAGCHNVQHLVLFTCGVTPYMTPYTAAPGQKEKGIRMCSRVYH